MIIHSCMKEYEVNIYKDFSPAKRVVADDKSYFVIDKKLYELYEKEVFSQIPQGQLFLLEAIEENKTIDTALAICERMTEIPAKRNIKLYSFGGGIVQDVTGFVANVLYRGIHWTFFPTTLLAACDSCIGGKTSLNYKKFKNLLGTFFPPDSIHICTPFFKTLTEKDFQSGLGEVVKFNIMFGENGVRKMEENLPALLNRSDDKLFEFVMSSLMFKKDFIEKDEFDRGIRVHLNFAHTFGHAFETVSKYYIPHGTAVAMGTIVANRISLYRGWLKQDVVDRVEVILKQIININLTDVSYTMDDIISAVHKDKKQVGKEITAVLMRGDMELVIVHDVTCKEIEDAVAYTFELFL